MVMVIFHDNCSAFLFSLFLLIFFPFVVVFLNEETKHFIKMLILIICGRVNDFYKLSYNQENFFVLFVMLIMMVKHKKKLNEDDKRSLYLFL